MMHKYNYTNYGGWVGRLLTCKYNYTNFGGWVGRLLTCKYNYANFGGWVGMQMTCLLPVHLVPMVYCSMTPLYIDNSFRNSIW